MCIVEWNAPFETFTVFVAWLNQKAEWISLSDSISSVKRYHIVKWIIGICKKQFLLFEFQLNLAKSVSYNYISYGILIRNIKNTVPMWDLRRSITVYLSQFSPLISLEMVPNDFIKSARLRISFTCTFCLNLSMSEASSLGRQQLFPDIHRWYVYMYIREHVLLNLLLLLNSDVKFHLSI